MLLIDTKKIKVTERIETCQGVEEDAENVVNRECRTVLVEDDVEKEHDHSMAIVDTNCFQNFKTSILVSEVDEATTNQHSACGVKYGVDYQKYEGLWICGPTKSVIFFKYLDLRITVRHC